MGQDSSESSWVQLCGTFAVELSGRRVDQALPGMVGCSSRTWLSHACKRFPGTPSSTPCEAMLRRATPVQR